MKDCELIKHLEQATKGLLWLSESDYPFETVYWQDVKSFDSSKLLKLTNRDSSTPVKTKELKQFFGQAIEKQDWYNEEEKAECDRYRNLFDLLQTNLTDLQVYYLGEVEIEVFLLGKTESGSIAGLSTKVVET